MKRVTKDYEIDYFLKGDRVIYTDGVREEIHAGDICFRSPGQEVYSFGDYDCYISTLDFSGRGYQENYSRNVAGEIQSVSDAEILKGIPNVFSPPKTKELQDVFSKLIRVADIRSDAARLLMQEILYLIHAELCHRAYRLTKPETEPVDRVRQYLEEHFWEPVSLEQLSLLVHLEKSYLIRTFRKKFSNTPIEYLGLLRLSRARDLLFTTNMTIGEIAFSCGYNNTSFFIDQYKKQYGMTPGESRKKQH